LVSLAAWTSAWKIACVRILPEYSLWNGEKLGYVDARKRIYCPVYARAVVKTEAFWLLRQQYLTRSEIWLWDFDGYDHVQMGWTLEQVLDCSTRKMGHAFVLTALLTQPDNLPWGNSDPELAAALANLDGLKAEREAAAAALAVTKQKEITNKREIRARKKANVNQE